MKKLIGAKRGRDKGTRSDFSERSRPTSKPCRGLSDRGGRHEPRTIFGTFEKKRWPNPINHACFGRWSIFYFDTPFIRWGSLNVVYRKKCMLAFCDLDPATKSINFLHIHRHHNNTSPRFWSDDNGRNNSSACECCMFTRCYHWLVMIMLYGYSLLPLTCNDNDECLLYVLHHTTTTHIRIASWLVLVPYHTTR